MIFVAIGYLMYNCTRSTITSIQGNEMHILKCPFRVQYLHTLEGNQPFTSLEKFQNYELIEMKTEKAS